MHSIAHRQALRTLANQSKAFQKLSGLSSSFSRNVAAPKMTLSQAVPPTETLFASRHFSINLPPYKELENLSAAELCDEVPLVADGDELSFVWITPRSLIKGLDGGTFI